MGEWSKKIGEKGEKIVSFLFQEILGYQSILTGQSIECIKGKKHQEAKSDKTTHGIDGLISSRSNLEDNVLDVMVISSRFTSKPYPNNPKTAFKKHITDLAYTLECFKNSKSYSDINKRYANIDRTDITGILVWPSNKSASHEGIIGKVANSILDPDLLFDKIVVIDNERISFLVDAIFGAKERYGANNVQFVYHNSNLNIVSLPKESYGGKLPVDYLYSNLIPLRVSHEGKVKLIIYSKDEFDEKGFSEILTFCKTFDHLDSAKSIIISYPTYNELEDKEKALSALMEFENYQYGSNLFIETHRSDFKNF